MKLRPKRPVRILAFDLNATRTGYAWFEVPGPCSAITMSHFATEQKDREERMRAISTEIKTIVSAQPRPDIIVWEAALPYIKHFAKKNLVGSSVTPNATQLMLSEIQGEVRQAAIDYSIAYDLVAPRTWRAALYGKGGGSLSTKEAKARAMLFCRFMSISPAPTNHDEAEAACIAIWARDCSLVLRQLCDDLERAA